MGSCRFLFSNGIVSHSDDTPPVSNFLETHPGAYTTTRTHNNGSYLLFWDRHLRRLADSARILLNVSPELLFGSEKSRVLTPPHSIQSRTWEPTIQFLVNDFISEVLPIALKERKDGEELAITTLVSGNAKKLSGTQHLDDESISWVLDAHVHVGTYVPSVFGIRGKGANLAVVGPGREVANAKYSDWVRLRKALEKFRPPLVTELLMSNDGDKILEGAVTNFFVVCLKDAVDGENLHDRKNDTCPYEVQTAPLADGVLPGVIRQLVIVVCLSKGIPFREVAPSLSKREIWVEAFITNSLRLVEHVEMVKFPSSWESLESKTWREVSWDVKQFEQGPGKITEIIQEEIMKKADLEGYSLSDWTSVRSIDSKPSEILCYHEDA